jgi:hypothetical protein
VKRGTNGTQHRGDGDDTLVDHLSQPVSEILIRTTNDGLWLQVTARHRSPVFAQVCMDLRKIGTTICT